MLTLTQNIDNALELSSFSFFTSKASQKLALSYLNRAYECARKTMVHKGSTPQERWLESYDLPFDLCHVREKHRPILQHLSIDCDLVFKLVEYRKQFKDFDIVKPTKKDDLATTMKIINDTVGYTKEYPSESQRNLEHYFGKDLWKRVTYTWHFVTNSHGTRFIRVFWFLDGKLTKLSELLLLSREIK
tara:strand:- start:96 stop:659 length:564 start_codon:yes stop_codon:yes gene_type:complete